MEAAIKLDPLFEQIMIIGEGKPYLAALAVLNPEHWQSWCAEHNLDASAPDTLTDSRVNKMLLARLTARLKAFPGYAQVRRLYATLEPWSVENGLLTPTLKMKRAQILGRYEKEAEVLFSDF
jgi:long-chain acyl-CoA synthetase